MKMTLAEQTAAYQARQEHAVGSAAHTAATNALVAHAQVAGVAYRFGRYTRSAVASDSIEIAEAIAYEGIALALATWTPADGDFAAIAAGRAKTQLLDSLECEVLGYSPQEQAIIEVCAGVTRENPEATYADYAAALGGKKTGLTNAASIAAAITLYRGSKTGADAPLNDDGVEVDVLDALPNPEPVDAIDPETRLAVAETLAETLAEAGLSIEHARVVLCAYGFLDGVAYPHASEVQRRGEKHTTAQAIGQESRRGIAEHLYGEATRVTTTRVRTLLLEAEAVLAGNGALGAQVLSHLMDA